MRRALAAIRSGSFRSPGAPAQPEDGLEPVEPPNALNPPAYLDPLAYNDRYTDRWPLVGDDFNLWPGENLAQLHDVLRDRENHRLFDLAMSNLAACRVKEGHYFEFGVCG